MKSTDKDSSQNKFKKEQSSDTLLYILLFILLAVLVGSLAWYFWPLKDQKCDYEGELGEYLTSPTARDVSKLISGNRHRLKMAKRVLKDEIRGRTLSAKEKEKVRDELKKVDDELYESLQRIHLKEWEKENPKELAALYSKIYEQGKITVRLRKMVSVDRSKKELIKQKEFQDKWEKWEFSEEEKEEIKKTMKGWIDKWYWQAREKMIDSGQYPLLNEYIFPYWIKGEEVKFGDGENPPSDMTKPFKKVHTIVKKDEPIKKIDLSGPLVINFQGYYGFLTAKDKKDSSEGSETFGLTKTKGIGGNGIISWGKADDKGNPKVKPVPSDFFSFSYHHGNTRQIKIGFEKKLFFNRLGYEEWITKVENSSRTYFNISFEDVVETIAHELAHAIVNTIKAKYDGEEEGGHGRLFYEIMNEIETMIKDSPDFSEFKTWWHKPEKEQKEWAVSSILADESHWDKWKYWYIVGGGVGIVAIGLVVVIVFWGESASSKKNVKS